MRIMQQEEFKLKLLASVMLPFLGSFVFQNVEAQFEEGFRWRSSFGAEDFDNSHQEMVDLEYQISSHLATKPADIGGHNDERSFKKNIALAKLGIIYCFDNKYYYEYIWIHPSDFTDTGLKADKICMFQSGTGGKDLFPHFKKDFFQSELFLKEGEAVRILSPQNNLSVISGGSPMIIKKLWVNDLSSSFETEVSSVKKVIDKEKRVLTRNR